MDLISEFKKITFFERLQPFFAEAGYDFLPMLNQFRRQSDKGFTNVILTPTAYSDVIYFELTFGSRINLIERSIEPYIYGLKGFKEDRNTAVTSLAKYRQQPQLRLKAATKEELDELLEKIKALCASEIFSYIDQLQRIEVLDQKFNAFPSRESEVAFNHELRCFRGITIASINQNPNWQEIHRSYCQFMEERRIPEIIQNNYQRLVHFLSTNGLN